MRHGLLLLIVLLAAGGCRRAPRPSVLLVTVDTLRADAIGAFGGVGARTPRLDGLAAQGVRFTRAQTACPLTLPSHATILTGLLPPEHGLRDNDPPRPLPPPGLRRFRTLAEVLGGEGYDTAAFVSASVLAPRTGLDRGFSRYDAPPEGPAGSLRYAERRGGETVDRALAWLARAREPFLLWVHLFDPHEPYAAPVEFRSPGARPGSREAYADEVAYADRCVGRLLAGLEARRLAKRTLVVVTADHGEGLGDHGEPTHGYLLYESTLRVPLLLRWPGRIAAGTAREDVVSLRDLYGTILAAAGVEDGSGSRPPSILAGPLDRPAFAETLYGWRHMGWAQLTSVRKGARKLIRGPTDERFDLDADPGEASPRAGSAPDLEAALAEYGRLRPLFAGGRESGPPLPGLPYLAGLGRGRLALLDPAENRKLPRPDPALAREIDRAKARVGAEEPGAVRRSLLALRRRDPRNPTISFWLGRNEQAAGDSRAAASRFAEAYEKGLREARVVDLWLKHLLLAGELDRAREVIEERVPEIAPDCGTYLMMGAYFHSRGDRTRASRMADEAARLARTPTDRELLSRFRHKLASGNDK